MMTFLCLAVLTAGAVWGGLHLGRVLAVRRAAETGGWSEPDSASGPPPAFKPGKFLMGILCVVYIISPIDLLPELILGPFGLIDDLGALFLAIRNFKASFAKD